MNDMFGGVLFLLMGIIFTVFHQVFARGAMKYYKENKLIHASEKFIRIGFLLGGLAFIVFGIIMLLR